MGDRVIHDKYLGTIFTKQQTGFDPQKVPISPEEAKERIKNLRQNIFVMDPLHGEELSLVCSHKDFDPYIKFGRDDLLYVKREFLD